MKDNIEYIFEEFYVTPAELSAFVFDDSKDIKYPWVYCCAAVVFYELGYITSVEYESIIYKMRGYSND